MSLAFHAESDNWTRHGLDWTQSDRTTLNSSLEYVGLYRGACVKVQASTPMQTLVFEPNMSPPALALSRQIRT